MGMSSYKTISGDTWDLIAYKVYGSEYLCDALMDANREKLDYFVFPDGIEIKIPDKDTLIKAGTVSSDYPTWRSMLNGQ